MLVISEVCRNENEINVGDNRLMYVVSEKNKCIKDETCQQVTKKALMSTKIKKKRKKCICTKFEVDIVLEKEKKEVEKKIEMVEQTHGFRRD